MDDKLKHTIIKYLNKEYSGLVRVETYKHPDYIFFMKDGKVIYRYNKENGYVYISYDKIWSFLESFFGLEYEEICALTKEWVEEQFKSYVTTIRCSRNVIENRVEEQFKSYVTTTFKCPANFFMKVEEQFKSDVTTTFFKIE